MKKGLSSNSRSSEKRNPPHCCWTGHQGTFNRQQSPVTRHQTVEAPVAVGQTVPQISLVLLTSKYHHVKCIFTPEAFSKCSFSCLFLSFPPPPYIPLNTQGCVHACAQMSALLVDSLFILYLWALTFLSLTSQKGRLWLWEPYIESCVALTALQWHCLCTGLSCVVNCDE